MSKKKEIAENLLLFGIGFTGAHILHSLAQKMLSSESKNGQAEEPKKRRKKINFKSPEYEMIVREQLVRNYQFYKEEGQNAIRGSYVIVIGAGSIGR